MRSIKARYNQQEKITPNASAYVNLQRAVRGQRFLHSAIKSAFEELVPKEDYLRSEKNALIEWLEKTSNLPKTR
jgi:hypothetical protein